MADIINKISNFWHKNSQEPTPARRPKLSAKHKFQQHHVKESSRKVVHVFNTSYSQLKLLTPSDKQ